jgi:hypothetical protein
MQSNHIDWKSGGQMMRNVALGAGLMMFTLTASAQSADWIEKWTGNYENQDQPGREVPPGYTVLNPFSKLDEVIIPLLQPWAAARREATDFEVEETGQVCRPTGLLMAAQNRGFQLVVSPGRITTIGQGIHTGAIRRIYLNREHPKNPPLTSLGDSVAHWEGDTLVVDTIGFDDKSFLSLDATRHSTELHVVERWRLILDGAYLEKRWTVDDPRALKAPYTFTRYHKKLPADYRGNESTCLSTPENWRAWVTIRNDAVKFAAEERAAAAKAAAKKNLKK